MANDNLFDTPEGSDTLQPALSDEPASQKAGSTISWRVVIILIALVLIGVLSYPLLQDQFTATPAAVQPELSTLTAPEATAQANPDSAEAQFELGNVHVRAGELAQAVAAYKKAIALDPNYQTAYANLGVVYYQQGQFDLAATQYKKALELDPNDGDVAYNLGALYLQQALSAGEQPDDQLLNQAIAQLERVKTLAPDLAEPYFGLGVAYTVLNRNEEAIQAFETYLARDTGQDPRASQEAERYLQTLRGK